MGKAVNPSNYSSFSYKASEGETGTDAFESIRDILRALGAAVLRPYELARSESSRSGWF